MIDIVLADNHEVVRTGLRLILDAEPDLAVVAEAADIESAERYVRGHRPDVLLVNLNLGNDPSLSLISRLVTTYPDTHIVVLTLQDDVPLAREVLRRGALGYVLKQAPAAEVVEAVRLAAAGKSYLNPRFGALVAGAPTGVPASPDGLSNREVDVLRLLASGHTNVEIADELILGVRTIETHRANLQGKSGQHTRAELVRYALANGLTE
jgi:two-component system response regulator NreC